MKLDHSIEAKAGKLPRQRPAESAEAVASLLLAKQRKPPSSQAQEDGCSMLPCADQHFSEKTLSR